ncbi:MAG: sigma-70 family RNA polymerase sigma factor [Anaerolineaceae bacterium]
MKKKITPQKEPLTDENAVKLAVNGDADAFSYIYEKNVTRIYNYIYYRIGSEDDAEDLTARVFHRAFGHIEKYQEKGVPFTAWLYRIAHNLTANWYRDTQRRKEISLEDQLDLPHQGEPPERQVERTQEKEILMKAIRRLPPDRQQLILLKYLEDLTNGEIAVIMGRTEGAIKSLYHRSLISLREEISSLGGINAKDLE